MERLDVQGDETGLTLGNTVACVKGDLVEVVASPTSWAVVDS